MSDTRATEIRRQNRKLGLVLGGVALAFFVAVIVKHILVG